MLEARPVWGHGGVPGGARGGGYCSVSGQYRYYLSHIDGFNQWPIVCNIVAGVVCTGTWESVCVLPRTSSPAALTFHNHDNHS